MTRMTPRTQHPDTQDPVPVDHVPVDQVQVPVDQVQVPVDQEELQDPKYPYQEALIVLLEASRRLRVPGGLTAS